jgi:hypothetical protein
MINKMEVAEGKVLKLNKSMYVLVQLPGNGKKNFPKK